MGASISKKIVLGTVLILSLFMAYLMSQLDDPEELFASNKEAQRKTTLPLIY